MLDSNRLPPALATTEVVRPHRGHFLSFNLFWGTRNPHRLISSSPQPRH